MIEALVVNIRRRGPGQMMGLGQADSAGASWLDQLTGGEYRTLREQLDRLEVALRISIVASIIAGIAGAASLLRSRR